MVAVTSTGSRLAVYGCGGCLTLILLALIGIYALIARTGLIGSAQRFTPVVPERHVEVSQTTEAIQSSLMASALTSLSKGQVTLVLTEEMLTAFLQEGFAAANEEGILSAGAQITVQDAGYLELFVPLYLNERATALTAHVYVTLMDGRPIVRVQDVRLGYLRLPNRLAAELSERLLQKTLDTQVSRVQGALSITDILLQDRALRLTGSVTLNPLQLLR